MSEFFVKLMVVMLAIDVLGRIWSLGSGKIEPKTPATQAWNLLSNGCLLIYGVTAWVQS